MERKYTKDDLAEMKAWSRDPKGAPFWDAVNDLFKEGVTAMRTNARNGDVARTAYFASHVDTLEEVLQLPDLIVQEHEAPEERKNA